MSIETTLTHCNSPQIVFSTEPASPGKVTTTALLAFSFSLTHADSADSHPEAHALVTAEIQTKLRRLIGQRCHVEAFKLLS